MSYEQILDIAEQTLLERVPSIIERTNKSNSLGLLYPFIQDIKVKRASAGNTGTILLDATIKGQPNITVMFVLTRAEYEQCKSVSVDVIDLVSSRVSNAERVLLQSIHQRYISMLNDAILAGWIIDTEYEAMDEEEKLLATLKGWIVLPAEHHVGVLKNRRVREDLTRLVYVDNK